MVHAGMEPLMTSLSIDEINEQIPAMMRDKMHWLIDEDDGLTWSRWYAEHKPKNAVKACGAVQSVLDQYGVARMIVGHTTQKDHQIRSPCNGRFILADIDMYKGAKGHVQLIKNEKGEWDAFGKDSTKGLHPIDVPPGSKRKAPSEVSVKTTSQISAKSSGSKWLIGLTASAAAISGSFGLYKAFQAFSNQTLTSANKTQTLRNTNFTNNTQTLR